ncbi:MAG: LPS export ABC transporter ATP-binding protein [Phycisphaeraceae bacterium]
MFILKSTNLVKQYAGRTVVDHVSFAVQEGEIVGLLGRNGAGKTTSFRMTMGMIEPDGGQVVFNGQDVSKLAMYQRAQRGMGYLAQEPSIFQRLTVEQNLMAILETRRMTRKDRKDRAEQLMNQFDLLKIRKNLASRCSGGEKRKLEIARALVTDPSLILLDEPFAGVDPVAVEGLQDEIRRLRDQFEISMLVTDHNVHHILAVCDRVYVIAEGKVFAEGTPKEIINDEKVKTAYLGSMFRGDEFD